MDEIFYGFYSYMNTVSWHANWKEKDEKATSLVQAPSIAESMNTEA